MTTIATCVYGQTPEELARRISIKLKTLQEKYVDKSYKLEAVESMADGEGGYVSFILYSFAGDTE